jgi:ribonuclease H / adenosylcobalamin/alpha-ribazole phosphatase
VSGRRLLVEADGGSRGNPGPAGYGAVVRDAGTGEVLAERAGAIGHATNNVAEYRGLISGLQACLELSDVAGVEARLDSKLVVEQMSGRWKVKHPDMKPLAAQAAALVSRLPSVTFRWVPRARNAHADALANAAMDAAARGETWSAGDPPGREPVEVPEPEPEPTPGAPARLRGWADESAPPTTTLLLRHGRTPMGVEKRFSGIGDPELDELGEAQAERAVARLVELRDAGRLDVGALVTSPLRRARATAETAAAALGLPVEVEEGLRETDFGDWDGYTFAEVRAKWPVELDAWLASPDVAPPYGESFAATTRRVAAARDRVLAAHTGTTVLCVAHVTPIKTLVRLALEGPASMLYRLHLDNASLTSIDWYADGPAVVRTLNETAHLHGL